MHTDSLFPLFATLFSKDTEQLWGQLNRAYKGEFDDVPNARAYHIFDHVRDVISIYPESKHAAEAFRSLFYHDAIYHRNSCPELATIVWMRKQLLGYSEKVLQAMEVGVTATMHGKVAQSDLPHWAQLVHDVDLVRLADPAVFIRNRDNIRLEFSMYPLPEFISGQRHYFSKMLEKPIFFTAEYAHLEPIARELIQTHIINRKL